MERNVKSLQVREAKSAFSAVVSAAERGRPTLITRHGQPSAMVVPVEDGRRLYPATVQSRADYLLAMPATPGLSITRNRKPLRAARL